jgi:hypothetical protein
MAQFLTIKPSDLTQLTRENDGRFPFIEVFEMIDGRREIAIHGPRSMPIWGDRYNAEARRSSHEVWPLQHRDTRPWAYSGIGSVSSGYPGITGAGSGQRPDSAINAIDRAERNVWLWIRKWAFEPLAAVHNELNKEVYALRME